MATSNPNVGSAGQRRIASIWGHDQEMMLRLRFAIERTRENDGAVFGADGEKLGAGIAGRVPQQIVSHQTVHFWKDQTPKMISFHQLHEN